MVLFIFDQHPAEEPHTHPRGQNRDSGMEHREPKHDPLHNGGSVPARGRAARRSRNGLLCVGPVLPRRGGSLRRVQGRRASDDLLPVASVHAC